MSPRRVCLATWLLSCFLPRRDVDAIVGDLEEEYAWRGPSPGGATWYGAQVLRSLPWCLWMPVQRGGWPSTLGVAVAVCVLQATIEVATALVAYGWLGQDRPSLVTTLVTLSSCVLLTYGAARVRPGAVTMVPAVALVIIVVRLLATHSGPMEPPGTLLRWLLTAPSLAFIGGMLSVRRHHR